MCEASLALRILTALRVAGATCRGLALTGLGCCASVGNLYCRRGGRLMRKREYAANEEDTERQQPTNHAVMLARGSLDACRARTKAYLLFAVDEREQR